MQGTSWPVRASIAASVRIDSGEISRRLLGASSMCSSATRSSVPSARRPATAVTSKRAGLGSRASWVKGTPFCLVWGRWLRRRPPTVGDGEGVDGVLRDQVETVGRDGENADAAGLDRQRLGADREVDGGHGELGEPADLLDAGLGV